MKIDACVNKAYNKEKFDHSSIAPLVKVEEGFFAGALAWPHQCF
jgi:hypothetical protein